MIDNLHLIDPQWRARQMREQAQQRRLVRQAQQAGRAEHGARQTRDGRRRPAAHLANLLASTLASLW